MTKTAVFVDFDNVYLGLKRIDEQAAERFASDPGRWLAWFEAGDDDPEGRARRIIVRRCYLNPKSFYSYRQGFVRSAFKVVDCPPLTGQGKTSTDVYLVMDVLDVLADLPHVDEYIILSADADFTPVLLRLRAYDKRTGVLAIGPASSAYTSAADIVYTEESFIEDALGIEADAARGAGRSTAQTDLLRRIADRFHEVAVKTGGVRGGDLIPVLKAFREFTPDSNWLGYHGLKALAEGVARARPDLALSGEEDWRVIAVEPGQGARIETGELYNQIVAEVARVVEAASEPVVLATAAHQVIQTLGPAVTETQWAGAGSFRALLDAERATLGLVVATGPDTPGFVYDPERHERPRIDALTDRLEEIRPELADFIRRIHAVTQAPSLTPEEYAAVFDAIAEAVEGRPYHLSETSRLTRDIVIEYGYAVPRSAIGFVLKGLYYRGFDFEADLDGEDVAEAFRNNVRTLADDAHVELDDRQLAFLDDWLLGGFDDDDSSSSDDPPDPDGPMGASFSREATSGTESDEGRDEGSVDGEEPGEASDALPPIDLSGLDAGRPRRQTRPPDEDA